MKGNGEIYLDNSATTKPVEEVIETVNRMMREEYGNPSSLHRKGIGAEKAVNWARKIIASGLGAMPAEIIFTSGGTESNNMAVKGYADANCRRGRHLITSKIEHPSVLNIFKDLEKRGYEVDYVNVSPEGIVDMENLKSLVRDDTILVSIMYVNNEVGTVQPIDRISATLKASGRNIALHVDAVQAFGKIPVDARKIGADIVSVSSHKIHGPKGVGAVFVKKGTKINPVFLGGGQEWEMRSGTENVPGICGFGKAAEIALGNIEASYQHVSQLRKTFLDRLGEKLGDISTNPRDTALSLPYIVNITFRGVRGEVLVHALEEEDIYISTGSACSSKKHVQSIVLKEMELCPEDAEGSVRVSFSRYNTTEEVLHAADRIGEIVPKLRKYTRR